MKSNPDPLSSFIRFIQLKSLRARTQESYLTWVRPVAWKFGHRDVRPLRHHGQESSVPTRWLHIFATHLFAIKKPDSHHKTKPHEEHRPRLPIPHRGHGGHATHQPTPLAPRLNANLEVRPWSIVGSGHRGSLIYGKDDVSASLLCSVKEGGQIREPIPSILAILITLRLLVIVRYGPIPLRNKLWGD